MAKYPVSMSFFSCELSLNEQCGQLPSSLANWVSTKFDSEGNSKLFDWGYLYEHEYNDEEQ